MIARMWHGKVPAEKAAAYHQYLLETGLKDSKSTKGNKAVFLLKKEEKEITHFYTLFFWSDWEAIKEFAGEDVERAKYYPKDKEFLLELEPNVTHFEVLEVHEGFGG
jgi:heme-degrading monooxygenase HmoA